MKPSSYPARTGLADDVLRRQLRHLATEWKRIEIGTVATGQSVVIAGSHTFTTYTTGGVPIIGLENADSVSMDPWTDGTGVVNFFQWNSGLHQMVITDWTGLELANGIDISDIGTMPYRAVVSSAVAPSGQSRLTGSGRIYGIEFESGTAFAASTSRFWTITAYLRRMNRPVAQPIGEVLGTFSTEQRSLVALDPVKVFSNANGVEFGESDRLVIAAAATGAAAPIFGASAWASIGRGLG